MPPVDDSAVDLDKQWDVAVIGTGIGGATLGRVLAEQGHSVLFIERGSAIAAVPKQPDGVTAEERLQRGWWPQGVTQRSPDGRNQQFFAPLGCALGGTSIHYAAALERMAASDFLPLATGTQDIPAWPISYQDFVPFYEAAERLYGVNVPVAENERLSEWDQAFFAAMRKNGLHPERLHVGMRYDAECEECIGRVCPRQCKADARTACLTPALRQKGCALLENCEAQTLEADAHRVNLIRVTHRGVAREIRSKIVVLAAGAFKSPQILLRSKSPHWPNGLANDSDQVGRNLMFHTSDLYAVWAPRRLSRATRQKKSISLRDFYTTAEGRLGYVQSLGLDAGRGNIAGVLKEGLRRRGLRHERLMSLLVKLPSHIASWMLGEASIFAAMTEDNPDPNNRILLDPQAPSGASFSYHITDELRQRADALRAAFAKRIRPWRMMRLSTALEMNYGHPCGTCRFGDDPGSSVLNAQNRAHGVENLFVVDASFMPRSGAVNPSLTIAANALRSAPAITQALAAG